MTPLTLHAIRRILDGGIPPTLCSVSADGVPHVNLLSHVEYVDANHVALTFQFFNRSRENIQATHRAALMAEDPLTGGSLGLQLRYLRTETDGPLFERLRAKLAGIAAHTGMEHVFQLRGADVYEVLAIEPLQRGMAALSILQPRCDLAAAARAVSARLADCDDLAGLLQTAMDGLRHDLAIDHAILWLLDENRQGLYALASIGYANTGIGAELPLTDAGLAGVAVRESVPLRIGHMARMYRYGQTLHQNARDHGLVRGSEAMIPLPGLAAPCSQLAVPLRARGRTVGALLVESESDQFFGYDDEDALVLLCAQLAQALATLQRAELSAAVATPVRAMSTAPGGTPLQLRHFKRDDTVFIDNQYITKGVAGAILWRVANEAHHHGRSAFTTRELRLAGEALRLPDVQDNLGVRLLLLQRRLADWGGALQIEKTGRGRFRLVLDRALELIEDGCGPS